VAAAVRRVLDDPSYRRSATRLGEQLRAEAESGAAVAELEALVAAGAAVAALSAPGAPRRRSS
jgi:UDP:flavonoid glycosyltransferase YjiC (YdhE family)